MRLLAATLALLLVGCNSVNRLIDGSESNAMQGPRVLYVDCSQSIPANFPENPIQYECADGAKKGWRS